MKLEELFALVLNERLADLPTDQVSPATIKSWNSLCHIKLITAMEETYGVSFTSGEILSLKSLADARQILSQKGVEL